MKKYLCPIVIFILIIVYFYSNYKFLKGGDDYSGNITPHHLILKVQYHNEIKKVLISNISSREKFDKIFHSPNAMPLYPPMTYIISFLISNIFGTSTFVTELSNIIYVAILFIGVYLLGRKIGSQSSGLLATFIISSFSVVSLWSRGYGLDLPLMSLTPWVIISLLNTRGFTITSRSILFGLFLGFVILFKLQILIFILGPLIYVLCTQYDNCSFRIPKLPQVLNLVISLILTISISYIVWDKDDIYLIFKVFYNAVAYKQRLEYYIPPYPVFSWGGFCYYFVESKIGTFYIILFILAFLHSLLRKEDKYARNILLLWILFPYFLFTLMVCKWGRWYLPSLPGVALFISLEVSRFRFKKTKYFLVILTLLFGLSGLIKNCFLFERFDVDDINNPYKNSQKIFTLMKEKQLYKKNAKLAIYIFNGNQILSSNDVPPYRQTQAKILEYNIKLYDPEVTMVDLWKRRLTTDADFIILLLDYTPTMEMLFLAGQLNALEEGMISEQQLYDISKVANFKIRMRNAYLEGSPTIQKAKKLIRLYKETYLYIPNKLRLYYISQIRKGEMTIDQLAQLWKVPRTEIASCINSPLPLKVTPLSFYAYTASYITQLNKALTPLLKYYTVIENGLDSDNKVIFLQKKNITPHY